jgi:hypothetical protein
LVEQLLDVLFKSWRVVVVSLIDGNDEVAVRLGSTASSSAQTPTAYSWGN